MNRKILIIDDEKPTLNMFRLFLSALGYGVLTAENGPDGLEKFELEHPPVVLTDVKMPGMDGIEVLERIKKKAPETEVIVITGHGDMELAIQALNLDATDFINKPVQRQALNQALKRAEDRIRRRSDAPDFIKVEDRDGVAVIHVDAELNGENLGQFETAFHKAQGSAHKGLIVSFHGSSSVHGKALDTLTELLRTAGERGIRTALAGISDNFRQVFETVGVLGTSEVHDTLDQAEAVLGEG